jgi:hypothetical protein
MSEMEWWRGCEKVWPSCVPDVGWTPISLGPLLKISHPGSDSVSST